MFGVLYLIYRYTHACEWRISAEQPPFYFFGSQHDNDIMMYIGIYIVRYTQMATLPTLAAQNRRSVTEWRPQLYYYNDTIIYYYMFMFRTLYCSNCYCIIHVLPPKP